MSTCCSVKLAVVWKLKSSPLMIYLCILQPPVSPPPFLPPFPYLSSLSRQKGTQSSCRAAGWLSWRLSKIVCLSSVCVHVCVSHAIMETVSKPEWLTVSCLRNGWRQIVQSVWRPGRACYVKWFRSLFTSCCPCSQPLFVCWHLTTQECDIDVSLELWTFRNNTFVTPCAQPKMAAAN